MFTQKFTVCLSALDLLQPQETGIVSHFRHQDETLEAQLSDLGINPGLPITLERRFPFFVIKVGTLRFKINRQLARSIYVRMRPKLNE